MARCDWKTVLDVVWSYTCYCTVSYDVIHSGSQLQGVRDTKVLEEEVEEQRAGCRDSQRLIVQQRRQDRGNSSP